MMICDLNAHTQGCQYLINAAISRVVGRGWFVLGPEIDSFEKAFAAYNGVDYCVTVANGTDALELALRALNVRSGDRVATVANAGMYTTTALLAIQAEPVFMDVDFNTRIVLLDEIDRVIHQGVKVIVVTHLYGQAIPDIVEIAAKCRAADVALIEDCAQAHGAMINEKRVGSFGDVGCFSFYPTKNLGALGDGGAVVTNFKHLAEKIIRLRQYGWTAKYQVEFAGARNSRLDEMQAAILSEFLPQLDGWNMRRREIATKYSKHITHPDVHVPEQGGAEYVAHLYVVRSAHRDSLRTHLRSLDIASDVHYPIPDYRQPVFGERFAHVRLANTERLAGEILTLPCYPEMTDIQLEQVIAAVNAWRL